MIIHCQTKSRLILFIKYFLIFIFELTFYLNHRIRNYLKTIYLNPTPNKVSIVSELKVLNQMSKTFHWSFFAKKYSPDHSLVSFPFLCYFSSSFFYFSSQFLPFLIFFSPRKGKTRGSAELSFSVPTRSQARGFDYSSLKDTPASLNTPRTSQLFEREASLPFRQTVNPAPRSFPPRPPSQLRGLSLSRASYLLSRSFFTVGKLSDRFLSNSWCMIRSTDRGRRELLRDLGESRL